MGTFCELKHIRTTVVGSEVFTVTEIKVMFVWIMTLFELVDSFDFYHCLYLNIIQYFSGTGFLPVFRLSSKTNVTT